MERSSNAHNFLIFCQNRLKFSPFVVGILGIPYYVGMMELVVRETEAFKGLWRQLLHPDK